MTQMTEKVKKRSKKVKKGQKQLKDKISIIINNGKLQLRML